MVRTSLTMASVVTIALLAYTGAVFAAEQPKPAQAQAAPAKADGQFKIGVVNRKMVFDSYKKREQGLADLEAQKNKLQVEIDALSKSIEAKKKKYEDEKDKMTDDERTKLKDEITREFGEYQAQFKLKQDDIDRQSQRFLSGIMQDIDNAVNQIGSQQNYHLILEADPKSPTSVIYFSTTLDITSQVIALLNGKS
ncbi:MAG: OmpH family outer membrane protein [Candidatus Hydrogenedentes bacterium]|nr:OmpH family outer membrane protein [Candidatus Hydrogenedentota bacterium]